MQPCHEKNQKQNPRRITTIQEKEDHSEEGAESAKTKIDKRSANYDRENGDRGVLGD
jgi:hypothetical protein